MNDSSLPDPPSRSQGSWLGLLLILAVVPYLPSLWAPFFTDDYLHIDRLDELRSGSLVRALRAWILEAEDAAAWWADPSLAVEYLRPLVHVSLWMDHALWGLWPAGYHLTNLVMHLGTTLLAYGIARRLLGTGLPAWFAAALFAVHPCHTESVDWVSGRTDLLASLLFYLAAYAYLRSRLDGPRSLAWTVLCLSGFTLALLSKENAVVFPALLLVYALAEPRGVRLGQRLAVPFVAALIAAVYVLLRAALFGGLRHLPYPFTHMPGTPDWLWYAVSTPVMYLMDLILFIPADPVVTQPFWRANPVALLILGGACTLGFASTVRAAPDWRTRIVSLAWLVLPLAPVSFGSPGERFLYMPSLGYCLLLGAKLPEAFTLLSRTERRALVGMTAFVVLFTFGKSLAFTSVAWKSRQVIQDAVAELDRAPEASMLLVVDLPPIAAMGFPHAIHLERPRRALQVQLLTLSQELWPADEQALSSVRIDPPSGVAVHHGRGPAYLGSFLDRALIGGQAPFQSGQTIRRHGLSVRIVEAADGRVMSFEARPEGFGADSVLVLQGQGMRLRAVHLQPAPVSTGTGPGASP